MWIDLDHISFAEWLVKLNACSLKVGYEGEPIVNVTGQLCWHRHYEDGLSPNLALELSEQVGIEFGENYFIE